MKTVKLMLVIAVFTVCAVGLAFAGARTTSSRISAENLPDSVQVMPIESQTSSTNIGTPAGPPGLNQPPRPPVTPTMPYAAVPFTSSLRTVATPPRNEPVRILVIPTPAMKMPEIAAIREDLAIMSRILDRAVAPEVIEPVAIEGTEDSQVLLQLIREGTPQALRQNLTEGVYVAGFGAIFSMRVNFPLLPPPQRPEPKETTQDTNNIWEQTKKEINSATLAGARGTVQEARIRQQRQPFDTRRVDELKEKLIESLKQASNIRALKPNDSVIIAVTAPAIQPLAGGGYGGGMMGGYGYGMGGYGGGGYGIGGMAGGYGGTSPDLEQNSEQVPEQQTRIIPAPAPMPPGQSTVTVPVQPGQPIIRPPAGSDVGPVTTRMFQLTNADAKEVMEVLNERIKDPSLKLSYMRSRSQNMLIATGSRVAVQQVERLIQQLDARERPFAQNCLIIKAKKGDIDEFAKGTITLETFKQRLELITY